MKKTFMMITLAATIGLQTIGAQSVKTVVRAKKTASSMTKKTNSKKSTKGTTATVKSTTTAVTPSEKETKSALTSKSSGKVLQTVGGIIGSITGLDKMSESSLMGTWNYYSPAVSFESNNLLAQAGGEVAASQIKSELETQYSKVGITNGNTSFSFNEDKSFKAQIGGKPFVGTWSLDEKTQVLSLKSLLFSMKGYVRNTTNGMELTFESKKILTLFQTIAALSGNTTISAIGDLSKNYEGVRVGFDLTK